MANDTVYRQVGQMVNTIRSLNDSIYQNIVPVFEQVSDNINTDFANYGKNIVENALILNKFISVFQDVILYEAYRQHTFDNDFSRRFKKDSNPLRRASFETFVNPIVPLQYDGEALERILKIYKRDVKKQVFVRNREDLFPISINPEEVMSAFQSMEAFMDFYNNQWRVMQNSNAIVEYNAIKQCINANYASGALKTINIHGKSAKEVNKLLKSLITKMSKPSSNYNNYINIEGATGEAVVTFTPKDSIVFMPNADLLAMLDTEIFASAYNLPFAEVTRNIIDVDDFGFDVYNRENQTIDRHENSKIVGLLADEYIFNFKEHLNKELSSVNSASLTQQTFLHIWQTIAMRTFCNCVLLIDDGEEYEQVTIPFDKNNNVTYNNETNSISIKYNGNIPESAELFATTLLSPDDEGLFGTLNANVTFDNEQKIITLIFSNEDGFVLNSGYNVPNGVLFNGVILNADLSIYIPFVVSGSKVPFTLSNDLITLPSSISVTDLSAIDININKEINSFTITPETLTEVSQNDFTNIFVIDSTGESTYPVETFSVSNNILSIDLSGYNIENGTYTLYCTYKNSTYHTTLNIEVE